MLGQAPDIQYTGYSANYCTNRIMMPIGITSTGGPVVPIVTTLAGSNGGYADGSGTNAKFLYPSGICTDALGNVYIADQGNNRIRKITPAGLVTTIAGSTLGYKDSTGTNAKFYGPACLTMDASGNIIVSDYYNHRIRKISPSGIVTTIAGSTMGYADDTGTKAKFNGPSGIVFDKDSNLVVVEQGNHRLRKVSPTGVVTFLAGSNQGATDGLGAIAKFSDPFGIARDINDNFLVADLTNQTIRQVDNTGMVTTAAGSIQGYLNGTGTSAHFFLPTAVMVDHLGAAFIADLYNHRIRRMSLTREVSTIAGSGVAGFKDSIGEGAKFNGPAGMASTTDGIIYVVDQLNHLVRKMTHYSISPPLPAGMVFNRTTGNISGIPQAVTPSTTYVVTGQNLFGTDTAVVTFSTGVVGPTTAPAHVFCNKGYVSELTFTGTAVKWYDTLSRKFPLSPSDTLVSGKTYYVTQTIGGCESMNSAATAITVNIIPTPFGIDSQVICNFGTIADLQAVGANIQWYESASKGPALKSITPLVDGKTYYATQKINGCESLGRFSVKVKIILTNAPTGSKGQNFCANAMVSSLVANGTQIAWYDTLIGGTPVPISTPLISGKSYYATQTVNTCESFNRLEVIPTINLVGPPTGSAEQTFCNFAVASELVASGSNVIWYDSVDGGAPLLPTTPLINGKTYYGSQSINTCPSTSRLPVNVVINYIMPPTGTAIQGFCNLARISDIQVSGSQVQWYSTATSAIPLGSNTLIGPGATYYATQTVNGCTSPLRFSVTIAISKTAAPVGVIEQSFCGQAEVAQLVVTGDSILWYDAPTGGVPISLNTPLQNGKKYYASKTATGCESMVRLAVTAILLNPDATILPIHNGLTAKFNGTLYQWRDCDNNMEKIPGATERSFYPSREGNYALEISHLGCAQMSSCVAFKFALAGLGKMSFNNATVYPNPIRQDFFISFHKPHKMLWMDICNIDGKIIQQEEFTDVSKISSVLDGPNGIYFIRLRNDLGEQIHFKAVKE